MPGQIDSTYVQTAPTRALVRWVSYLFFEGRPLTTRGRWLNAFILPMLQGLGKIPAPADAGTPLFIVGSGRSGTTALGVTLSMHKDVGFLNEPKALWHTVFEDEDLVGNYSAGPGRYCLTGADATDIAKEKLNRLYGWYRTITHSDTVLDKYPEMVFRLEMLHTLFADLRVLVLVRNGHDTCQSVANWSARHKRTTARGVETWWGLDDRKWHALVEQLVPLDPDLAPAAEAIAGFTRDEDRSAVEWILCMRAGREAAARWPGSVMPVRYEELTNKPRDTLSRICSFAGLSRDERMLSYAENTLHARTTNIPCELDPVIVPAFRRTMAELGYAE